MKHLLLVWAVLVLSAAAVQAAPLDLVPFARVTASGTQPTFLLMWPRETDDAPYTVRDDDPDTGWKTPRQGIATLSFDFAPLGGPAPHLAQLDAEWETKPNGAVTVRAREFCGGRVLVEQVWKYLDQPLAFGEPAEAYCVEVEVRDAGPGNLREFHVYAAPVDGLPEISNVSARQVATGLRLDWKQASEYVHHVEIHFVESGDTDVDRWSLVGTAMPQDAWLGPLPLSAGMQAVLVPVAEDGSVGPEQVVDLPSREAPLLENSGVVEGFYGRPWSHAERRAMMTFLARLGLGLYIYGPKNDPLHRDEWRTPYDDQAVARFVELLHLGAMVGVTFSFGISPGKDMDMDDPVEKATLLAKLQPFVEGGFRHFTLLLDDIEGDVGVPIDGELAAQHVALANWLRGELSAMAGEDVALWVVPTVYSSQRQNDWPGGSEYLDVCAGLDPQIEVMWTGTDTFSPTLEAADLVDVTSRLGRQPVIWDNEHGTDGGDGFMGKVYLAPYQNRSADLVDAVVGIVTNPMILGAANRLMLGTYALYLRNAADYEPDDALGPAAREAAVSEHDRQLAVYMAETFYGNGALGFDGLNFPNNRAMNGAIEQLEDELPDGSRQTLVTTGSALLHIAAEMATTQNRLHHSTLDVSLVDDLWFPCDRLTDEGQALLRLLDFLSSVMGGFPNEAALAEADRLLWEALFHDRYQLSLMQVNSLRRHLAKQPPEAVGFTAPSIFEPATTRLKAAEEWTYAVADGAEVAVYGLAEATVSGGTIRWTPPHAGRYEAIVLATTDSGWSYRELSLTVKPADEPPPSDDDADDDGPSDDDAADDDSSPVDQDDDQHSDESCGC